LLFDKLPNPFHETLVRGYGLVDLPEIKLSGHRRALVTWASAWSSWISAMSSPSWRESASINWWNPKRVKAIVFLTKMPSSQRFYSRGIAKNCHASRVRA
jgi:hypothetical protein